jgi:hypothetical protein
MRERSGNEAESKVNSSASQASPPVPAFKASLILDAFTGIYCDKTGWAQLTLRTVNGEEFTCFVDGIVAKGFSDRLLGLAGNLLLQSHGESADLRPLHELDDDDADAEREIPPNLPAIAPQPLTADQKEKLGSRVIPPLTDDEKEAVKS